MKKLPVKYGFTAVELLVVIAIIGFLAGLFLPTLSRAKEKARKTVCANNLRQFAMAYEMYADDYYERFPDQPKSLYDATDTESCIYKKYINTPEIFWCPSSINRKNPKPTGAISNDSNSPNYWGKSYSFVFGLTTSNSCSNPVPMISDKGVYEAGKESFGNHKDGVNVLYLDGSVKWVNKGDMVYPSATSDPTEEEANVACGANGESISLIGSGTGLIDASVNKTNWGE